MTSYRTFLEAHERRQAEARCRVVDRGFVPDLVLLREVLGRRRDDRYGINVIARPPGEVVAIIEEIRDGLREIDDAQYFYPAEDLHLTILEIRQSLRRPPAMEEVDQIRDVVASVCATTSAPQLADGRLAFDENAVALSCFPSDDRLETLRSRLREGLASREIESHARYDRKTAHVTFVRYLSRVRERDVWSGFLNRRQETVLPVFWEIGETFVTAGATWYGRSGGIEARGPLPLSRSDGRGATS